MQLFRIVFLSCLLLQALLVHRSGAEGAGDEHIDPRALALRLRSEICATNKSQFQEFYKAVRDMEDKDIRYPASKSNARVMYNYAHHVKKSWHGN